MAHKRLYKSHSPHWCILCFLHCIITLGLWHKLLRAANLDWVPPRGIGDMLIITFRGLGKSIRGKTLWHIACLTVVWIVSREKYKDSLVKVQME